MAPVASAAATTPAPSPTPSVPALSVGKSGVYTATDSATGVKAQMQVTVASARYVTPAEAGTTTRPQGQFVDLKLSVKNVGSTEGSFAAYGAIKWEDVSTAAQEATTLTGAGTGPDLDTAYKPGQALTGDVVLDVPRKGGTLSYWDSLATGTPSFTVALPAR